MKGVRWPPGRVVAGDAKLVWLGQVR